MMEIAFWNKNIYSYNCIYIIQLYSSTYMWRSNGNGVQWRWCNHKLYSVYKKTWYCHIYETKMLVMDRDMRRMNEDKIPLKIISDCLLDDVQDDISFHTIHQHWVRNLLFSSLSLLYSWFHCVLKTSSWLTYL